MSDTRSDLPLTQALSPAAVGKAYLRRMGVHPIGPKCTAPTERIGQSTTAYYGGRAECRIRLTEVPCVYADVSSEYPTVFNLGRLWRYVVAERIDIEDATRAAQDIVTSLGRDDLLDRSRWPDLAMVFCRIRPAGELLPVRADYTAMGWQIGLNYLDAAPRELWFTLADLVANVVLGGPRPMVLEAFRFVPVGVQSGLVLIALRGSVLVDPRDEDLFVQLVEERHRVALDTTLDGFERQALKGFLKTLANSLGYGIWAEMRSRRPFRGEHSVEVAGLTAFSSHVPRPEEPGEYCFPPLAATITGLARLLLATIQSEVEAVRGTYLACDTDSLIVVSNPTGGDIRLPSGETIRALSWSTLDAVRDRVNTLNPYDRQLVPELLKLEDDNFARGSDGSVDRSRRVPLFGVAISAKRFALYEHGSHGETALRKRSEHGLGALVSPTGKGNRWIDEVWRRIVARARRLPDPDLPAWYELPALSQVSATSAAVLKTFDCFNHGRPHAGQVKPANFLLLAHDDPLEALPVGLDRNGLTLIAPYSSNPAEYLGLEYRNRFDGRVVPVTTTRNEQGDAVRIKTIGDVVAEYGTHPEAKSGGADGLPCTRATRGVLTRLHVVGKRVRHIGKESNRLDEVEAGEVRFVESPVPEYVDERGEWEAVLPRLVEIRNVLGLMRLRAASGLSERALRYALRGERLPRRAAREKLSSLAQSQVTSGATD